MTDAAPEGVDAEKTDTETTDAERTGTIEWLRTRFGIRHQLGLLGVLLLGVLPFGLEPIQLLKLTGALYFAMFAMSWDAVSIRWSPFLPGW